MNSVLIGIPTFAGHKQYRPEVFARLKQLLGPFDLCILTKSGKEDQKDIEQELAALNISAHVGEYYAAARVPLDHVVEGRNAVRKYFLAGTWSHLLFIDSDVIIPINTIPHLKKQNKDIISGVYLSYKLIGGRREIRPLIYLKHDNKISRQITVKKALPPQLIQCSMVPLGATLIRRAIIEKIPFRRKPPASEDITFCLDADKAGFSVWCDTSIKCAHRKLPQGDKNNDLFDMRKYH